MNLTQLAVRDIKSHRRGRFGWLVRLCVFRRFSQDNFHVRIRQVQAVQRILPFRNNEPRACGLQMLQNHIDAHRGYQRIGMESHLIQQQLVHRNRSGQQVCALSLTCRLFQTTAQAQGMYIKQCIPIPMTDIETVDFYVQRQFPFALEGAI